MPCSTTPCRPASTMLRAGAHGSCCHLDSTYHTLAHTLHRVSSSPLATGIVCIGIGKEQERATHQHAGDGPMVQVPYTALYVHCSCRRPTSQHSHSTAPLTKCVRLVPEDDNVIGRLSGVKALRGAPMPHGQQRTSTLWPLRKRVRSSSSTHGALWPCRPPWTSTPRSGKSACLAPLPFPSKPRAPLSTTLPPTLLSQGPLRRES